jgi:hypothetical protein
MGMEAGYGECRVTSLHDARGSLMRLRIDQADPRILITRELLEQMQPPDPDWPLPATFDGEIVRIRGENRSVIYRVVRYLPELGCYEAEWPD